MQKKILTLYSIILYNIIKDTPNKSEGVTKMKIYYKERSESQSYDVLTVEEKNIVKEAFIARTIYVAKENVQDVAAYKYGEETDEDCLEIEKYYFVEQSDLPKWFVRFVRYVSENYFTKKQTIMDIIEEYREEESIEEKITKEMVQEIMAKFSEMNKIEATEKVTYVWDGRNHQRIILETDGGYDPQYTEDHGMFSGLEQVEREEYKAGYYELAKNDDYTFLIDSMYYQSSYTDTYYDVGESSTIEEALRHVKR